MIRLEHAATAILMAPDLKHIALRTSVEISHHKYERQKFPLLNLVEPTELESPVQDTFALEHLRNCMASLHPTNLGRGVRPLRLQSGTAYP